MAYTPRQWKNLGQLMRIKGHNIFVIDSSEHNNHSNRPCIVLIHGYPTSSWDWESLWPLLEPRFRLVSLDLLGFGFSEKPYPHPYLVAEQADIVEALVQKLGLDNFHVLSHDYGDTVAQELLARQNEAPKPQWLSLCLLNGGLFPETHKARFIQKLLASPLGPQLTRMMKKKTLHKTMAEIFGPDSQPTEELIDGFWEVINYNNGRRTLHKLIDYMRQRREHRQRWVGALKESRVPICLINGSVDPISGKHMVERYKEVVGPPLMIFDLENIGHYPQWEAPQQTCNAYERFLDTVYGDLNSSKNSATEMNDSV